jgi:DNA processing protein
VSDRPVSCTEREAWAVLAAAAGVGPVTFGSLVRRFGSARAVLAAAARPGSPDLRDPPPDPEPGARDPLRDPGLVDSLVRAAAALPAALHRIAAAGAAIVTADDPEYPRRLRAVDLAPPVIYVVGDVGALDAARMIAVVGTRRPSEAGRALATRVARGLVERGAVVVSGLAIGIDGAAHAAVIGQGGRTLAVLGSGIARPSPRAHRALAERIVTTGGALVSELAPDVAPGRATFPRRNRIVSGLADATVVIEAGVGSGALITARWALEQGRECFLAPGPIGAVATAGSLHFLREHAGLARIVAGVPELLEDLGYAAPAPSPEDAARAGQGDLGAAERMVLSAVDEGLGTVDQLAARTGLATASVLGALTRLELLGLVVTAIGRYRPAGARAGRAPSRM